MASPPSLGFSQAFCLGTSPHLTSYMPRIACLLTQGAAECYFGGSCPPSQLPEERPHRGKGSSSLGAFEAQGGEGLPCAPDLGGPGSAPHLPPWEESRETMGRGALAPEDRPAGSQAWVWRRGVGHALPTARRKSSRRAGGGWGLPTGAPDGKGILGRGGEGLLQCHLLD